MHYDDKFGCFESQTALKTPRNETAVLVRLLSHPFFTLSYILWAPVRFLSFQTSKRTLHCYDGWFGCFEPQTALKTQRNAAAVLAAWRPSQIMVQGMKEPREELKRIARFTNHELVAWGCGDGLKVMMMWWYEWWTKIEEEKKKKGRRKEIMVQGMKQPREELKRITRLANNKFVAYEIRMMMTTMMMIVMRTMNKDRTKESNKELRIMKRWRVTRGMDVYCPNKKHGEKEVKKEGKKNIHRLCPSRSLHSCSRSESLLLFDSLQKDLVPTRKKEKWQKREERNKKAKRTTKERRRKQQQKESKTKRRTEEERRRMKSKEREKKRKREKEKYNKEQKRICSHGRMSGRLTILPLPAQQPQRWMKITEKRKKRARSNERKGGKREPERKERGRQESACDSCGPKQAEWINAEWKKRQTKVRRKKENRRCEESQAVCAYLHGRIHRGCLSARKKKEEEDRREKNKQESKIKNMYGLGESKKQERRKGKKGLTESEAEEWEERKGRE